MQSTQVRKELQELRLRPSSPQIKWELVVDMAGTKDPKQCWIPPSPPFKGLDKEKVVTQTYDMYVELWKILAICVCETGLYPLIEVALFDAILTYQGNGGVENFRVAQQFRVLDRQGADFTVDFSCGIVQVCSGFCEDDLLTSHPLLGCRSNETNYLN